MTEWLWLSATFLGIFLLSFAVLQWANMRRERVRQRLEPEPSADALADSNPELVLGEMTPALASQVPVGGAEKRQELQRELQQAGFYRSSALMEYAAVRAVLVILPLLFGGLFALLVAKEMTLTVALIALGVAVIGFSLPRLYINLVARSRRRQIEKGLPVAVDLLSLGLLSGQNILDALRRVCQEIRFAFPVLARELEIARQQAELNTLPHALGQMAERVQVPEVRNLVIILNQAQRQGSDAATALLEFSNNFRTNLRQQADKQANQANFWMLIPSVFFLWAPAFALLLAPVVFSLRDQRDEMRRTGESNRQQIDRAQQHRLQSTPRPGPRSIPE